MYCTTIPIMKKQRFGNVIQMSGGGATKPMPYASAYAASKAAIGVLWKPHLLNLALRILI